MVSKNKGGGETVNLMIRPSLELLRWYQNRAAELQLKSGVTITHNKLMVQDMEELKAKDDKAKGAAK